PDSLRDLAQLHIYAANLPAVSIADSSQVRPGVLAIAIGNPMGFVGALATGVIHGVGPLRGLGPHSWVQAEVRLAPGNSGGPLADRRSFQAQDALRPDRKSTRLNSSHRTTSYAVFCL